MTRDSDAASSRRPPIGMLRQASLFLDFDGTLIDIAPRPDEVRVSTELRDLLECLRERLDGRLAILTGRSAADVARLLHPLTLSIGGHHGLETRHGGFFSSIERSPLLDKLVEELRSLELEHPGVLVENKPLGIALHYRQAPHAEKACRAAIEQAAERSGFEVQHGKMVCELRPRGGNKGDALARLMAERPFIGTIPVFLGDDLTDEPAFITAQELGGAGIIIGERSSTAANYQLASVPEAIEWLEQACVELR